MNLSLKKNCKKRLFFSLTSVSNSLNAILWIVLIHFYDKRFQLFVYLHVHFISYACYKSNVLKNVKILLAKNKSTPCNFNLTERISPNPIKYLVNRRKIYFIIVELTYIILQ